MALTRREFRLLKSLCECIELNPQSPMRHRWMQQVHRYEELDAEPPEKAAARLEKDGEYDRARVAYYAALDQRPKDKLLRHQVGDLCFKMGRIAEGVAHYATIADDFEAEGFLHQAAACVRRALREAPGEPSLEHHRLRLYILSNIKVPRAFLAHGQRRTPQRGEG